MSVRLFIGYFLVLAACATVAFAPSQADPSVPPLTTAGMIPGNYHMAPAASFHVRSHKTIPKQAQIAEAE